MSYEKLRHDGKPRTERSGRISNYGNYTPSLERLDHALNRNVSFNTALMDIYDNGFKERDIDPTGTKGVFTISDDYKTYYPITDEGPDEDFDFLSNFDKDDIDDATNLNNRGVIIIDDVGSISAKKVKNTFDKKYKVPSDNIKVIKPSTAAYNTAVNELDKTIGDDGQTIVIYASRMKTKGNEMYSRDGSKLPLTNFDTGITTLSKGNRECTVIGANCHAVRLIPSER